MGNSVPAYRMETLHVSRNALRELKSASSKLDWRMDCCPPFCVVEDESSCNITLWFLYLWLCVLLWMLNKGALHSVHLLAWHHTSSINMALPNMTVQLCTQPFKLVLCFLYATLVVGIHYQRSVSSRCREVGVQHSLNFHLCLVWSLCTKLYCCIILINSR